MRHPEILELLSKRIVQYIHDDLGLEPITAPYEYEEVETIHYHDISTFISLNGNLSGTIGLSLSNQLAKNFAKSCIFGDIDDASLEELAAENVAEMLNITLGNIIKDLTVVKEGGKVEISTPYTLHNSVQITKKKHGKMYLVSLPYLDETIIVSYFI